MSRNVSLSGFNATSALAKREVLSLSSYLCPVVVSITTYSSIFLFAFCLRLGVALKAVSHTFLNSSSQQNFRIQAVALATILKPVIKSVFCLCKSLLGGSSRAKTVCTNVTICDWSRSSRAVSLQPPFGSLCHSRFQSKEMCR